MRCGVPGSLTHISDTTGFDRGEYFHSLDQVRGHFKVEVMGRIYPKQSFQSDMRVANA
jgi:hypothetical protein